MYEKLETLPRLIAEGNDALQKKLEQLSTIKRDMTQNEKAHTNLKERTKKHKLTMALFGGEFPTFRQPLPISTELWSCLYDPERVSVSRVLRLMTELELSLQEKSKRGDPLEPWCELSWSNQSGLIKAWHDRLHRASCTEEGITRSEFYSLMAEILPEGDLADRISEIMDNLKRTEPKKWKEQIWQVGLRPPPTPKEKPGQKKDGKKDSKFQFKNWFEYKTKGGFTATPSFPRPDNCPASKKYWCSRCGYANHSTDSCFRLHPELENKSKKSSTRHRSRSRSPVRRRNEDGGRRSDRK